MDGLDELVQHGRTGLLVPPGDPRALAEALDELAASPGLCQQFGRSARARVLEVGSLDRMDASLLRDLLVEHSPEGLLVLPAPLEPAFADQIGAAEMVRIVETLRTFAGFVVIATPAYPNPPLPPAAQQAPPGS